MRTRRYRSPSAAVRRPTYVAFDLLMADGIDLRPLPLRQRKALEGIVAKHLADAYHPKLARWHKVLNRAYSQRHGRAEWFRDHGRRR